MGYLLAKWDILYYLCNVIKKHKVMEAKTIIIARSYSQELFYLKKFKNEKEAISHGERITHQYKGCVITYLKEKRTGHRWEIDVIELSKGGMNISNLVVNSKKSAKLVAKNLKEYDDTLKIHIYKVY
jgi:hypothetical protein